MQFMNGGLVHNLEMQISKDNVIAQIELLLRAIKVIRDDHDVISIEMGELTEQGGYPLKIKYKEERSVETIDYRNGK